MRSAPVVLTAELASVPLLAQAAAPLVEGAREAAPRLAIAGAVLVVGYLIGRVVRALLRRRWCRTRTESFARVMSKLAGAGIVTAAFLLAATTAFPSVKPVDLLAGLGIFSVAVGFAFQDILENLLAGVLLLVRQPFESGDQVVVGDAEGTVQGITIRETRIKTYDGRLVIIPNADVYKDVISVNTAFEGRRSDFVVGVAYESDLAEAKRAIVEALSDVEGVRGDPAPEALLVELGASTINIDVRYWTDTPQHNVRVVLDRAMTAVKVALDDAGIEMPCDIVALQATSSFRAALDHDEVTPGGSVAA